MQRLGFKILLGSFLRALAAKTQSLDTPKRGFSMADSAGVQTDQPEFQRPAHTVGTGKIARVGICIKAKGVPLAPANKMVRIVWPLMTRGGVCQSPTAVAQAGRRRREDVGAEKGKEQSGATVARRDRDPSRFRRAENVGAFPGLTPRRYQSGEMDWSGHISKCGDGTLRSLLFGAATTLFGRVKKFSALKSYAVRLAARRGFAKAAVASARELVVLMLTLWKTETEFKWKKEAKT